MAEPDRSALTHPRGWKRQHWILAGIVAVVIFVVVYAVWFGS